jgi:NAD(P)-dependent dehydrogenase (short-subunit alcohol dehydrogenase family)
MEAQMKLQDQRIVVIGASQGIGFETSKLLAQQGADVIMVSKTREKIESAAKEIGLKTTARTMDFTDESAVEDFFAGVGVIDHLVCVGASNSVWGKINEIETSALKQAFNSKFFGYFFSVKHALPFMSKDGSIVFVIAGSARKGIPGTSGLAAVNGAILSMGRTLAAELGPIRVNMVSPGIIDTPYYNWMKNEQKQTLFKQMADRLPVGRIGKPEEVARAIVMLLENDFVTGAVLDVDGGASL